MRLSLRSGEKLYLNGAVIAVDRRVSVELLNDAVFLLESHVMQAAQATTPLRQLYFVVQLLLIDPANATTTRRTFDPMIAAELGVFEDPAILAGLADVRTRVEASKPYEALKILRGLFALEDAILGAPRADTRAA